MQDRRGFVTFQIKNKDDKHFFLQNQIKSEFNTDMARDQNSFKDTSIDHSKGSFPNEMETQSNSKTSQARPELI